MKVCIVIPARYQSSRYPGKPLVKIGGREMVLRMWDLGRAVVGEADTFVATDDQRIAECVTKAGGAVVMTPESCRNGTERAWSALEQLESRYEAVVNLQGDAVLTPPWIISAVVERLRAGAEFVTPAVPVSWQEVDRTQELRARGDNGGTFVVTDVQGRALYFSSSLIPYLREAERDAPPPVLRHIGLYGYSRSMLARYLSLPPGRLERVEGLEQLRALEHGIAIDVVTVDYRGRSHGSVDSPQDVERIEEILAREGELLPVG